MYEPKKNYMCLGKIIRHLDTSCLPVEILCGLRIPNNPFVCVNHYESIIGPPKNLKNFLTPALPSLEFRVKKEGWGGGGMKHIKVTPGVGDKPTLKSSGKVLNVSIDSGLPKDSHKYAFFQS